MTAQSVKAAFDALKAASESRFKELPGYDEPVVAMYGWENGRQTLIFFSQLPMPELRSSAAVDASVSKRYGGLNALKLAVADQRYEELFCKICDDLLSVMVGAASEGAALSRLADRYEAWRAFWKNRTGALSEEAVRGLTGELIYFRRCLDEGVDPAAVASAWIGPMGGDQDFVFPNRWAEVKTIRQSASEVQISSLEQLVNPKVTENGSEAVDGRLAVIRLHGEPAGEACLTLPSLVEEIVGRLSDAPHAQTAFINTIEMTGADLAHGVMETTLRFSLLEIQEYDVNAEGFPRIIRTPELPAAVTKVRYSLSLAGLEPWRIQGDAHE